MDPLAFAIANRAAGAAAGAVAIEVSLGGVELAAEAAPIGVAVAGGEFRIALDGRALPPAVALTLQPGEALSIKPGPAGVWCYVAIAGAVTVPPVLGSVSTHTRSGIGGLGGRTLQPGDFLPVAPRAGPLLEPSEIPLIRASGPPDLIRVVLGPQDDYFAPDQIAAFLAGPWRISSRSDRMAYQLEGPVLRHAKGFNIVSDGIALGAIQVPGDGRPIALMADRQPTGGYPKIATVIRADLGRLAQCRAGATVRFESVTVEAAVAAWRAALAEVEGLALRPLVRRDLSSEFLLGVNLVDGVTSGG